MISIIIPVKNIFKYALISLFIRKNVFVNYASLIERNYIEYTYFLLLMRFLTLGQKKIQVLSLLSNYKNIFFYNYKKIIIIIFLLLFQFRINYHLKSNFKMEN